MSGLALVVPSPGAGGLAHQVRLQLAYPPPGFAASLYLPSVGGNDLEESAASRGFGVRRAVPRNLRDVGGCLRFWRSLRRERPEVVHIHLSSKVEAPALAPLARLAGARRVILTEHAPSWSPSATAPRRFASRWSGRSADIVISPSLEGVGTLAGELGIARSRLRHVPSAIDPERYSAEPTGRLWTLMSALPWPHGDPSSRPLVVGGAGLIGEAKDPDLFASVMGELASDAVQPVWIGDGPERHRLEKRSGSGGPSVFVTGWIPRPDDLYADLDVFVSTSRAEGTPVVLLEAMAAGRAVVATRVGGMAEVIEDGVTGLLVEPGDGASLVSAVRSLLTDASRRKSLGESARALVRKRYGAQEQARALWRIYAGE